MDRYAVITPLGTTERFAVLTERKNVVRIIGVSRHGIEWQRWASSLPETSRRSIDQLLGSLGPHFRIEGPSLMNADRLAEFDALAVEQGTSDAKDVEKALTE